MKTKLKLTLIFITLLTGIFYLSGVVKSDLLEWSFVGLVAACLSMFGYWIVKKIKTNY